MPQVDKRLFTHMNWVLLALTLALYGVGLLNLYSASHIRLESSYIINPYFQKQLYWGLVGFGGMLLTMCVDYNQLKQLAWPAFIVTILLLAAVPLWGVTIYGAKRWLSFGFFNFQPTEVAKISILIIGAKILSGKSEKLGWAGLFFVLGVGAVPAGLIKMQPDLGSALNLLLLLGGIILYRGLTANVLKTLLVVGPLLVPLSWFFMEEYQKKRITSFLDPASDPHGGGWNVKQALIAIGSGGIWGKGYLAGSQSQLRFLPEKHTDFAVAVFGEEWGFVGCMTLLALYSFFLMSIFATARDAKDRFGSFLAAGVFFYFFWQIFINMGMVLRFLPAVGIPLPFLSYGGSTTLVNFILIGLVLNVSMRRYVFKSS